MVVGRELRGGVWGYPDTREQAADGGGVSVAFKMLDDDLAIEQRARQAVLETKLSVQRALRVGAIGVLEPPLVDPCLEACDLGRLQIVQAQQQQGVDGRVGAAAA